MIFNEQDLFLLCLLPKALFWAAVPAVRVPKVGIWWGAASASRSGRLECCGKLNSEGRWASCGVTEPWHRRGLFRASASLSVLPKLTGTLRNAISCFLPSKQVTVSLDHWMTAPSTHTGTDESHLARGHGVCLLGTSCLNPEVFTSTPFGTCLVLYIYLPNPNHLFISSCKGERIVLSEHTSKIYLSP